MLSLYKDILYHITNYCDEFTKYFLMQTCTHMAKLIYAYDINIFIIESYSILNDAPSIYKWFADNNRIVHISPITAFTAAISKKKNDLINSIHKKYEDVFEIDDKLLVTMAIKHHNNEYIDKVLPYINNNYKFIKCCVKYSNMYAYSKLQSLKYLMPTESIIEIAIDNNDINMLTVIKPEGACVCYLSPCNKTIVSWCKNTCARHYDIDTILQKINDSDHQYIYDIITRGPDHHYMYEIHQLLHNICVEYIKTDDLSSLEFMLSITIESPKYTKTAIKYDRIDILRYLYSLNYIYLADLSVAIKHGNMQIINFMYPQYAMIANVSSNHITKQNYKVIDQMMNLFQDPLIVDKIDDLDMVSHLIDIGCDWTSEILYNAMYNGNWRLFKYAYNNGCPTDCTIKKIYDHILSTFGPNICD